MFGGTRKELQSVCPQLCCLHADMLSSLGPKEAKKAFLDFYHSFLEKTAVRHTFLLPCPLPPFSHDVPPMSTCGGDCQPWPSPESSLRPFPPRPPEVHLLPLTPVSSEQVLRVPVPPHVAFELGKERRGLGIREGLSQVIHS